MAEERSDRNRICERVAAFNVMLDNLRTEIRLGDSVLVERARERIDALRRAKDADDDP